MSDEVSEVYRALYEQSKIKRANNREASARMLNDYNIRFIAMNQGAHLVVQYDQLIIDFWPGTGLWIARGSRYRGRGVKHLIRYVQNKATVG